MNLSYFFTVIVLGLTTDSVEAQATNAPINTIPEGISTFTLEAVAPHQFFNTYLSAPLINDPMYTGAVASINPALNQISVADSPPPWQMTITESVTSTPYYLKFLSGAEVGRILQIASNTTSTVTLDTKDGTSVAVPLNAPGFVVEPGDTFEIFVGDTLGSMFGTNVTGSPLILKPGNQLTADTVSIFSATFDRFLTYYFDNTTSPGSWKESGATGNFNNAPIPPYQGFVVTRNGGNAGEGEAHLHPHGPRWPRSTV